MRPAVSWVLTALGPALVALGTAWLCRAAPPPTRTVAADERLGRVVNAQFLPGAGVSGWLDETFAHGSPPVVVLGASYANANVDADALARALGRAPGDVVVVSLPSSVGAHWLAVAERALFRPGLAPPEHLILVGTGQSLLMVQPPTEASWLSLYDIGPSDAVLDRIGTDWGAWRALRVGRSHLRSAVLGAVGAVGPALLYPGWSNQADGLLSSAFADARMDPDRAHARWSTGRPRKGWRPSALPTLEESFLPSLYALASSHGTRTDLVRVPVSRHVPARQGDTLLPETAAALRQHFGASWVDLSGLVPPDWAFLNLDHLDDEGATAWSTQLGWVLRRGEGVDLFGPNPGPEGWKPPLATWSAAGPTPEIRMGVPEPLPGGLLALSLGRPQLSDARTAALHPRGARCSPIRVRHEAGVLPHGLPCGMLRRRTGATCHGELGVVWKPVTDGPWTVEVAADRGCDGALWLYPEDRVAAVWPSVPDGANEVVIDIAWAIADVPARVEIFVDGVSRVGADVGAEPVALHLGVPVPTGSRVVLEMRNGDGWGLVTSALLRRGSP